MTVISEIYGPLVTGYDVEQAVISHIRKWMPTYLLVAAEHAERELFSLPLIRSFTTTPREPERWSEDQLPAILCVSPGLVGEPAESGDGDVRATWAIGLAVIVSTSEQETSGEIARLYGAAIRLILIQKPSLGGFADGTTYMGEAYDLITREQARSLGAASIAAEVEVSAIGRRGGGLPFDPLGDPNAVLVTDEDYRNEHLVWPEDWPLFETEHVEVRKP